MRQATDLKGRRFDRLEVLERAGSNEYHYALWKCKCECGTVCIRSSHSLVNGYTRSCGCLQREAASRAAQANKGRKRGKYKKRTKWAWNLTQNERKEVL